VLFFESEHFLISTMIPQKERKSHHSLRPFLEEKMEIVGVETNLLHGEVQFLPEVQILPKGKLVRVFGK
jgi:hypothetical protein